MCAIMKCSPLRAVKSRAGVRVCFNFLIVGDFFRAICMQCSSGLAFWERNFKQTDSLEVGVL